MNLRPMRAVISSLLLGLGVSALQAAAAQDAPASGPAPAEPGTPAPTQLPGVNVEAKRRNPFEESDRRLRELIDKSTPCIGCDAKKPDVPPSILQQVLDGAAYLITPQGSQPLSHDDDVQKEVDRATYEQRHPVNSTP